jgi:heme/copper-type cytochrome/quinol oxidase subunit 2
MIGAALPVTAWLLILAVLVIPLAIEFTFIYTHWRARYHRRPRPGASHRGGNEP